MFHLARIEDRTLADTRREFEVNYFGYLRLIQAVLPHMREQGQGIIHNVSSGAGITGTPALSGYASTKGAIEALVRSLRFELHDEGVHVTLMHPPLTNTRAGAALGYPGSVMQDPADVGRKLARRIDSTDAVIYADLGTRIGLFLAHRLPSLVRRGSKRFADAPTTREQSPGAAAGADPEARAR
ncbi:SDR family NAD(P)-dependent oxidoreductase [Haloglomus litoreum]|uniref:SDR family NAD(P)-dependent oxidoreductase n=1 Tax=Haloglomus litoreum TaxID=3034026 RepID=UPI0023E7F412|nr:SDR family NAD(P)-dependent oxidoreductase [Haloglomus sp. DT116]